MWIRNTAAYGIRIHYVAEYGSNLDMDTQDLLQIRSDPQHFAGSVLGIVRSDPMKTLFSSGRHDILDIIFYGWI